MFTIRWLGHSTFIITTGSEKNILIDPFLEGNPKTPEAWKSPDKLDHILLTHGHDDHAADAIPLAKKTGANVVSIVELSALLKEDGLPDEQALEMNKGGTVDLDGVKVTMTHAQHSSSWKGRYAGEPGGFIIHLNDFRIYHAGDTNIMADFELYGKMYQPDLAILPIGDHYTMGPEEAAYATAMLKPRFVVPMHYGTMPVLTGSPETLRDEVTKQAGQDVKVIVPEPGDDFGGQLTS
ncbi:MAG: metal-dependent hydrolase [Cyclonatronaceae bacterium]